MGAKITEVEKRVKPFTSRCLLRKVNVMIMKKLPGR